MTTYECLMPNCRAETYQRRDVCEDCWDDRRGQLDSLPDLYVMTYAMLTPGSRMLDITSVHIGPVEPGVPINLVALDALSYSYDRLAAWAAWAARLACQVELNLRRYTTGAGFLRVVHALQAYDHKLARSTSAGEYVLDVWTAYRRLVLQCIPNEPRNLAVPCPVCAQPTVLTRHADEYAICLTCATQWPHSQLPTLGRQAQRTAQ